MELLYHESIPLHTITEQIEGCTCDSPCCLQSSDGGCVCRRRSSNPYNTMGLLTDISASIFECNSNCSCDATCQNRVVQTYLRHMAFGRKNTANLAYCIGERRDVGKCLIATRDICRGELVCVYMGEIIPVEVGLAREADQFEKYGRTYVLTVREYAQNRLVYQTCIDGDVTMFDGRKPDARLINHSCEPNTTVIPVRVENLIPYAVMFANQFIPKGTEFTYDYADGVPVADRMNSGTRCRCNSNNCVGYLPRVQ